MIRAARTGDFAQIIALERVAGEAFRHIGMAAIADDAPPTAEELGAFLRSGSAWVSVESHGSVIAYLLVEQLDSRAHIEQVSVHPAYGRRGIGASLIETASRWSAERGLDGLSLTTFADVPWNAPYYSRLGFAELAEADWTAGLRGRMAAEAARGLAEWPRIVMVRGVGTLLLPMNQLWRI